MPDYINMYFAADNSQVSKAGNMKNPIELHLRTDLNEEDEVRLYLEAEVGYQVQEAKVSISGATSDKWALAPDNAGSPGTYGAYGAPLLLGLVGAGSEGRVYFWAKAKTVDTEEAKKDITVTLQVNGVAEPV